MAVLHSSSSSSSSFSGSLVQICENRATHSNSSLRSSVTAGTPSAKMGSNWLVLKEATHTWATRRCHSAGRVPVCAALPVWDPLLHVHVHQLCQVLYVAHLGGLQRVNLELGHSFLSELLLLAALLQLLPQGDDISNAGPEAERWNVRGCY